MDKYLQAEYIFNKLNEAGAGLGTASIFTIKEALQDLEAAQQNAHPTVLPHSETAARCPHCQGQIVIGLPSTAQRVA